MPDPHALVALLLTVAALILFSRDRIPLEASSLAVLVTLLVVFQLFPYETPHGGRLQPTEFLAGFGNEALITIGALLIMAKGLELTGALQPLSLTLGRTWTRYPRAALGSTIAIAAMLSAFLTNVPVAVMLLPMLIGVAARNKLPPSSILMPVGLATLLGGAATTIGTSTNLLIVGIAEDAGLPEFHMFAFTLPAFVVGLPGLLYLWLIAPRVLPVRKPPLSDTSPRVFNATLHITEESAACGKTFAECLAMTDNQMRVDRIERGVGLVVTKLPSVRVQAGDRFVVRDTPERLKLFEKQLGATLHDAATAEGVETEPAEQEQLAEIVVTRGSMLHRASLAGTRFAQVTGLLPLALHRARAADSEPLSSHINLVPLRAGDVVLVQGTPSKLEQLKRSGNALVVDATMELPRTHRANRALAIMTLAIGAAAFDVVPISVAAVLGVGLMLSSRCLAWRDIGKALSLPVVMIIVTSLALSHALIETGAAAFVARQLVTAFDVLSTPMILSSVMLVVAVLTNVVSNNAVGVIGAPIAIEMAKALGAPAEPFVLAVLFGANMSYATPYGYQTNLLVLSAGGYKVDDFLRVGVPLVLIAWLGFSIVLPLLYDV